MNNWVQRWRRKWKAAIGRVHTQLGGGREVLSDKAGRKLCPVKNLKMGTVLGSVFGPVFWAHLGALHNQSQLEGVPFLGPCFGTPENAFFSAGEHLLDGMESS